MRICPGCRMPIPEPLLACMACTIKASERESRRLQAEAIRAVANGKADLMIRTHNRVRHIKQFGLFLTFCNQAVEPHWRQGALNYQLQTLEGVCPQCREAVEALMEETRQAT